MTLAFPRPAIPLVSIVMATHGAWEWTRRSLAAVRQYTKAPIEVIVCDNASPDETPDRLAELTNALVVLNSENLGFGTACNQGAALARAPYVIFLNSDAVVHENWLPPLLEHLELSSRVGAVGPLLLNPDGSIQWAGSTILEEAVPISHSDEGADLDFPRVVDFVAGACMATRRATFHAVGGFDSAFGLGYYEDADLCYRLRAVGYDVLFEPGSVVTHGLGISSDDTLKHELAARNQRLFRERWGHALAGRPSYAEARDLPPSFLRDLSADARLLLLPGRSTERCRDLALALGTYLPNVRVTVLGRASPQPGGFVEWLSEASPAVVLRSRRFQYDAVVTLDVEGTEHLEAALDETQPQATRIEYSTDGDLLDALAEEGVACG